MVEKVNIALNPNATPEERAAHDAAMAKVAEGNEGDLSLKTKDGTKTVVTPEGEGDETGVTKRPEDIPEKFWDAEKGVVNVEALLKSQKDGEEAARAAAAGKTKTAEELAAEAAAGTKTPEEIAAEEAAAKGGDQPKAVADASAEYAEKGELSPETYASLAAQGLTEGMVNDYIAGQKAIVSTLTAAASEPFGSAEGYNTAADWAAANLDEAEIAALDVQLTSTNPAIVKQGAAALQEKYAANADIDPLVTIQGNGAPAKTGTSFRSSAEMQAAMSDPRYKTDPAYRDEVAAKVGRSDANLFG
jgi:hypothetical protein